MRYLVTARVRPGRERELLAAIESGRLGQGSIAGDEYLEDMAQARLVRGEAAGAAVETGAETAAGDVRWVEVCFCPAPLLEERPYWEEYFDLVEVRDAHSRRKCRDETGEEPWACCDCDCTAKLEAWMRGWGRPFLEVLREAARPALAAPRGH
jgi:hypothetical protein